MENDIRKIIDEIDSQIIDLLKKRIDAVIEIGKIKKANGKSIYVPEREKEILAHITNAANKSYSDEKVRELFRNGVRHIYNEILSMGRQIEEPIKIAYLGPEASFTHQAAIERFGHSVLSSPLMSISDIFHGVETERFDYGIVPVENSTEGVVNHTLDMFIDSNLKIVSEQYLTISQYLISNCKSLAEVKKVYSHPSAFAQCRKWLSNNLENVEKIETSSTAKAASVIAWDKYSAAISSKIAAEIYDLDIIAERIEDVRDNFTRFLIIGRNIVQRTGNDKTSIMISIEDRPGILFELLQPFSNRNINLTKIESRPSKRKAWEYVFFIDFIGHSADKEIKEALSELSKKVLLLKNLGSYPIGEK